MSRARMFLGLWLGLILFAVLFPAVFYTTSALFDRLLGFGPVVPEPYNAIGAAFSVFIGGFWAFWAYSYLHFIGRGSPVEAFGYALYPTRELVTTGPYAYTRNPVELGMLFVLLGIALFMRSLSGLVLIPIIAMIVVIYVRLSEEPQLVRRFGSAYEEYRKAVPVLIPWSRTRD